MTTLWTLEEKVAAGFVVAFVLLTAVGMAAYRRTDTLTLRRMAALTTQSRAVIEHTERVLSEMKDAETGQRGFVITGEEPYLEPFTTGSAAVAGTMTELRSLTADSQGHQKRLKEADRLIAGKLDELWRTIRVRRAQGFEATRREILQGQGQRYMDDLRAVVEQMERDERALLKQRTAKIESSGSRTRTEIGFGTVLCLIVSMAAAAFFIRLLMRPIGFDVQYLAVRSAPARRAVGTSWRRAAPRPAVRAPSSRF